MSVRIGTAGWAIPRQTAEAFPEAGSGLERYAARFGMVEINSTFYRSHRQTTYARWAATTPAGFRFAVKLPRAITHEARLVDVEAGLEAFRQEVAPLGDKLGPLLIQLPPSLAVDAARDQSFCQAVRSVWTGAVVCEPRHQSWFEPPADERLSKFRIGRVAADPARHPKAGSPDGWAGVAYWRWHGSPKMYASSYDDEALTDLAAQINATCAPEVWCVFDNTSRGAAAANALRLQDLMS